MRVIVLDPGGENVWIPRWADALRARGHQVRVVSCALRSPVDWLRAIQRIRRERRVFSPHVIWAHFGTTAGFVAALAKGRVPLVVTLWGSDVLQAVTWRRRWRLRVALARSDQVTTTTVRTREFREALDALGYRGPVTWTQWGFDERAFTLEHAARARDRARSALGFERDDYVVGSIRHARELYNVTTLVRGFAQAPLADRSWLLILAGASDQGYLRDVKRAAREHGVADRVRVIEGFLGRDEMRDAFAATDAPVSIPTTDRLGAPIMESLALGRVPVLADLPVYREILHDFDVVWVKRPVTEATVSHALCAHASRGEGSTVSEGNARKALRFSQGRNVAACLDAVTSVNGSHPRSVIPSRK